MQQSESAPTSLTSTIRQANLPRLIMVALQLALLLGLAQIFNVESFAFRKIMALALVGFVIHHLLPMALRLPFFVLLSLGSLALVVGPIHAARLIGVGLVLISLCHLPVRFIFRLLLIIAAAAVLVSGRAGKWFPLPGYDVVWPILGSMFMFRLIIYLYDLKNRSAPFSLWRSLAYFFMLPNVCFPMYPVVDYQAFNRNYFDQSPWRAYQVGIKWIFRGLIHLLIYRLVTQNLTIEPETVSNAADLTRYMVATYLMYLLISGQFHIVVGILHLFGFNLPETHHLYYLSSSFTDFWRRINIYWKDFILKIFFNPIYFRCKKLGPAAAMTIATLVAFFFTWLLHSYQWFWIRGTYPMIWQDMIFWGVLALLVLVNALYEQRYGRNRKLKGQSWTIGSRIAIGLQTIGTFCVIVTLWCLWTFQGSLTEWFSFMANFGKMDSRSAVIIVAGLAALGVASALMAHVGREYSAGQKTRQQQMQADLLFPFWRSAAVTVVLVVLLTCIGKYNKLIPWESIKTTVAQLRETNLGLQDRAQRDQGYYEDLTNTKNYNLALWELYNRKPAGMEGLKDTEIAITLPGEFHQFEFVPSKQIVFRNVPMSTNRWGMRDRDYEKQKPPGTYRIVLHGASVTMGWCVLDDQTFENVLEDRLNTEFAGRKYDRIEILNLAMGGYKVFHKLWTFERSLEFQPDAVIWDTHSTELEWLVQHLTQVIKEGIPIPYPEVRDMLQAAGLNAQISSLEMRTKLTQLAPQLLSWVFERMKHECDKRGISLYVLIVPRLDWVENDVTTLAQLTKLTQQAGIPVLDMATAYSGPADLKKIRIAAWDDHPNAEGHRLLADTLYDQMLAMPYWRSVFGVDPAVPGN